MYNKPRFASSKHWILQANVPHKELKDKIPARVTGDS